MNSGVLPRLPPCSPSRPRPPPSDQTDIKRRCWGYPTGGRPRRGTRAPYVAVGKPRFLESAPRPLPLPAPKSKQQYVFIWLKLNIYNYIGSTMSPHSGASWIETLKHSFVKVKPRRCPAGAIVPDSPAGCHTETGRGPHPRSPIPAVFPHRSRMRLHHHPSHLTSRRGGATPSFAYP